jgi:hypothetical protein
MERGKWKRGVRKVGLGFFRFRMFLLYIFLDSINPVQFGPV